MSTQAGYGDYGWRCSYCGCWVYSGYHVCTPPYLPSWPSLPITITRAPCPDCAKLAARVEALEKRLQAMTDALGGGK